MFQKQWVAVALLPICIVGALPLAPFITQGNSHSEQIAQNPGFPPTTEVQISQALSHEPLQDSFESYELPSGASNNSADTQTWTNTTPQWTVMIYLDGDSTIETYAQKTLTKIMTLNPGCNTTILILYDGNGTGDSQLYQSGNSTWENRSLQDINATWTQELNMGDPSTLKSFISYGLDTNPLNHCMLELWGHGYGWAGICSDETNNDRLTTNEIQETLSTVCTNHQKKIDVLVYTACNMADIEVVYGLHHSVNYFVGSQDSIPASGLPHHHILDMINNRPIDSATLVRHIISSYAAYYQDTHTATLAGWNLEYLSVLVHAVDRFIQTLNDSKNIHSGEITDIFNTIENFGGIGHIDLYDFAHTIQHKYPLDSPVSNAAQNVLENITITIISEWHGRYHQNTHGISIYYPTAHYLYAYKTTLFANHTSWGHLIQHH